MEINNVVKFNTTAEYEVFKSSTAYTVPNVSWIVKENKIASEPYLYPLTSGIVVHKNGVFKEVSYDDFNEHYDSIIAKGYSIEGVIAVPSTHTPDGTTRIMSLKLMSTGSPETGTVSSGNTVFWGGHEVNLSGLTHYNAVAKISNVPGETTISVNYESGYIPSDFFISGTGAQSVVDDKAKYASAATQSAYCPSPYITGDGPNPLYRITGISSSLNVLSDMDGSANTEVLIENATAQTNWRTASTITNDYRAGYYPAACCCKRYGTSGLPSGSWYLPAMGELGYVAARLGSINALLTLIMSKDSSLCVDIYYDSGLASSSEYVGNTNYYSIYLGYCRTVTSYKMSPSHVRAFSAVHSKPMVF